MVQTEYQAACVRAAARSANPDNAGCSFHVTALVRVVNGEPAIVGYYASDWYTEGSTVATYVDGSAR